MTEELDEGLIGIWTTVTRGVTAVQHALSLRTEAAGVSPPYAPVLLLLLGADEHRLPMSRIAKDLAMTSGGFTKLADRMARDGLIDRRGSAGDRRVVFAALTTAGEDLAREVSAVMRDFISTRVLVALSPAELQSMAELSDRLRVANEPTDGETAFQLAPRSPDAPDRRRTRDR